MVQSLPFSQFLRAKHIVSNKGKWLEMVATMTNEFKDRSYPSTLIQTQFDRVNDMNIETKGIQRQERFPFVSTFSSFSPKIGAILKKHWPIVRTSFPQISKFQSTSMQAYRKSRSLRDNLVKSQIPQTAVPKQSFFGVQRKGSFPCLNCTNCKIMVKGEEFKHPGNGTSYHLQHYLTCLSEWVFYGLWCPCNLVYVGETTHDLRTWLNNHLCSIRKKRMDLPVSKHCSEMVPPLHCLGLCATLKTKGGG